MIQAGNGPYYVNWWRSWRNKEFAKRYWWRDINIATSGYSKVKKREKIKSNRVSKHSNLADSGKRLYHR